MKIWLYKFRKHDDIVFEFPPNLMTYIDGCNGKGKSTIFKAIQWVLYGKVRKVANRRSPNSEVRVSLETDDGIIIERSRKPKFLRVLFKDGSRIEGSVAQSYIDNTFGQADTWLSTSYVVQDGFHPIIHNNPAERMKLLNSIAFEGDDPSNVIMKLSSSIKSAESAVAILTHDEKTTYSEYLRVNEIESREHRSEVLPEWILTNTESLEREIKSIILRAIELRKQQIYQGELLGEFNAYNEMLEKSEKEILLLDTQSNLETKKQELILRREVYLEMVKRKQRLGVLQREISSLDIKEEGKDFTDEEIVNLKNEWNQFNINEQKVKSCNIEYTKSSIEDRVRLYERIRDAQWMFSKSIRAAEISAKLSLYKDTLIARPSVSKEDALIKLRSLEYNSELKTALEKYKKELEDNLTDNSNSLRKELEELSSEERNRLASKQNEIVEEYTQIKSVLEKEISTLRSRITELDNSRHIHLCPHCGNSLRVIGQHIEKSEVTPFNNEAFQLLNSELSTKTRDLQKAILDERNKIRDTQAISEKRLNERKQEKELKMKTLKDILVKEFDIRIQEINSQIRKDEQNVNNQRQILNDTIQKHDLYISQKEEIEKLEAELRDTVVADIPHDIPHLNNRQLSELNSQLIILQSVIVVEKPSLTVEHAIKLRSQFRNKQRYLQIQGEISSLVVEDIIPVTQEEIDTIDKLISSRVQIENTISNLKSEIQGLGEIPDIERTKNEIHSNEQRKGEISLLLKKSKSASRVKYAYDLAYNTHLEAKKATERLVSLLEMKRLAIETQSQVHYTLIKSINEFLASASSMLFDEPIGVTLSTLKQNKTGENLSCVNIAISYQGDDNAGFESLSGGEMRKINTLLSLAFSCIFGSKMMILDESMSCLSPNKRDAMVKVIKQTLPERTVLVTCHGISKGLFDHVISL